MIDLIKECIKKLAENPFILSLRTHKLKRKLSDFCSTSINFSFRIIFEMDKADLETIILINIVKHDEGY